jgi:hypothetical protein
MSESPTRVELSGGTYEFAISTNRGRDGTKAEGSVELGPWEAVVLEAKPKD